MIAIIDYNAGNIQSVKNALDFIGAKYFVAATPDSLVNADGIIIPGVGSFDFAMTNLITSGLDRAIKNARQPILGICLGQQLLLDESEEGDMAGLGLISGKVKKLKAKNKKIPNIGWTSCEKLHDSRLLKGLDNEFFYFVHSFACFPKDSAFSVATSCYGETFSSIVEKDNVFGVQFHPEKSGNVGIKLLMNFVDIVNKTVM